MRIITIGREFGSGGRELGKRLADQLGIPCYDKEIIDEVAKMHEIAPEQVEYIDQIDVRNIYIATIGRTIYEPAYYNHQAFDLLMSQGEAIKKLAASGDCVIVGRQADVILKDLKPLNLFVYASRESKLKRCMERASEGETEKYILKKMKKIDKVRASNRHFLHNSKWGDRNCYDLCINTSDIEIKSVVSALADYVTKWFENNGND